MRHPREILEIREERLPNRSGLSDRWDEQEPKWEEGERIYDGHIQYRP